ncbi:MAG: DUF4783 domain-containing protein [Bacteroidetes bacterium]|nr:DUF4783 domain-containing protein [Bacteroidota bacterium]
MKKYAALIYLFLLPFTIFGQDDISQTLAGFFRSGNTVEIAKYFDATVDMSIPKSEGVYSKQQAEIILKNFFTADVPQSFTVFHQGSSKDGSKYFIGNLVTKTSTYRTYVYLKNQSGKFFIHQLRIDREEKE